MPVKKATKKITKTSVKKTVKKAPVKKIVKTHVVDVLDHSQFDVEVDWFKNRQPSTENLVIFIWNEIQSRLTDVKLHRIRLHETPTIFTDYYGEE